MLFGQGGDQVGECLFPSFLVWAEVLERHGYAQASKPGVEMAAQVYGKCAGFLRVELFLHIVGFGAEREFVREFYGVEQAHCHVVHIDKLTGSHSAGRWWFLRWVRPAGVIRLIPRTSPRDEWVLKTAAAEYSSVPANHLV